MRHHSAAQSLQQSCKWVNHSYLPVQPHVCRRVCVRVCVYVSTRENIWLVQRNRRESVSVQSTQQSMGSGVSRMNRGPKIQQIRSQSVVVSRHGCTRVWRYAHTSTRISRIHEPCMGHDCHHMRVNSSVIHPSIPPSRHTHPDTLAASQSVNGQAWASSIHSGSQSFTNKYATRKYQTMPMSTPTL